MLGYLDKDDLFVYLRMLRATDSRLFLVVEGESDLRTLEAHINSEVCGVIPGYGKRSVVEALGRLEPVDEKAVGLVDRDFDYLVDELVPANIVTTYYYDREADLLLKCKLLANYIGPLYCRNQQTSLSVFSHPSSVMKVVIDTAAIVGRVRWSAIRDRLDLNLSKFPIGAVMRRPRRVIPSDVIGLAIHRTQNCKLKVQDVQESYQMAVPIDKKRLCNGHDLVSALAVSSRWWASNKVGRKEIDNFLKTAVRCDILSLLPWFKELGNWADRRGLMLWKCNASEDTSCTFYS